MDAPAVSGVRIRRMPPPDLTDVDLETAVPAWRMMARSEKKAQQIETPSLHRAVEDAVIRTATLADKCEATRKLGRWVSAHASRNNLQPFNPQSIKSHGVPATTAAFVSPLGGEGGS
jgi:hypothetical protein